MANGPQISHTLQECCTSSCSGAAYIEPGSLWENPFSASFYGRSRDEFLNFELEGSQAVGIAALYPVQHPQTAFSAPSGYALGDSPAGESGLTTHQL